MGEGLHDEIAKFHGINEIGGSCGGRMGESGKLNRGEKSQAELGLIPLI